MCRGLDNAGRISRLSGVVVANDWRVSVYSLPPKVLSRDLMLMSKKPESCWLVAMAAEGYVATVTDNRGGGEAGRQERTAASRVNQMRAGGWRGCWWAAGDADATAMRG